MMWRWFLVALCVVCQIEAYNEVSTDKIRQLVEKYPPEDYLDRDDKKGFLEPILKVRLPGTDNSTQVRQHFHDFFNTLDGWSVTLDDFTDDTPIEKNVSFTNLIATKDPANNKEGNTGRLVLAAHYDSKLEPEGFIGAIDSAFPCAAMMYVAKALDEALSKSKSDIGLQLIFFDGEEAFQDWTDTDSIYGARHLASKMQSQPYPTSSTRRNSLDSIDNLVLLDLLGTAKPTIPSYFKNTDWLHQNLGSVQTRLGKAKVTKNPSDNYFIRPPMFYLGGLVGDDHLPFLNRNVPILHLIPHPFPSVWHKMEDNADCLDSDTMHDWAVIMTMFTAEYLSLFI